MNQDYSQKVDRTSAEVRDAIRRAVGGVSSDFDLRNLLVGVVRAARTLSGARYGALGVVDHDRRHLVEFVTDGVTAEDHARIGAPPTGRGLLGYLIDHPQPLRLDNLHRHPASTGFPTGHPGMTTFLGIPIRVRGRVFGNLYLTDKTTGAAFTADDEAAVAAMAHLAGIAIEHAHLLITTESRTRWLEATARMPGDVLSARTPHEALEAVLRCALDAAQGVTAMAIAPASPGRFSVRAAVGDVSPGAAITLDSLHPTLMLAMATSTTRWIDLPNSRAVMTRLVIDTLTRGALVILVPHRRLGGSGPDGSDFIADYANQASRALEKHHTRAIQAELAILAERNRIARDLHDVIIQRLFALGLQLQTMSGGADHATAAQLHAVIGDLDATIGEIRRSIVDLRPDHVRDSVRAKIHTLVAEYSHVLGYSPSLTITGPLDTLLDPALHHHVIAVLREGLSNSARHASAHMVWLAIEVTPARLTCTITDDGTGFDRTVQRSGLRNLAERAAELQGTLQVSERRPHGCTLTWQVPLSDTPAQHRSPEPPAR